MNIERNNEENNDETLIFNFFNKYFITLNYQTTNIDGGLVTFINLRYDR